MRSLLASFAIAMSVCVAEACAETASPAPSFSCSVQQITSVERRICSDSVLANLDRQLAYAAADALAASDRALARNGEEAAWLSDVRDACASNACLANAYGARIVELRNEARTSARPIDLLRDASPLEIEPALRKHLVAEAQTQCLESFYGVDLGDGLPSVMAVDCGRGANNIDVYLFRPAGGRLRLIFSGVTDGLDLQSERSPGLRRLRVRMHGSASFTAVTFYDFDGSAYRAVACGAEEIRDGERRPRYEISTCLGHPRR